MCKFENPYSVLIFDWFEKKKQETGRKKQET